MTFNTTVSVHMTDPSREELEKSLVYLGARYVVDGSLLDKAYAAISAWPTGQIGTAWSGSGTVSLLIKWQWENGFLKVVVSYGSGR